MALHIRGKYTFRAHDRKIVVVKKRGERVEHVLMKALLWALYLPQYPQATIEVKVGDRYKPDVVALDTRGEPVFWAEAGRATAMSASSESGASSGSSQTRWSGSGSSPRPEGAGASPSTGS